MKYNQSLVLQKFMMRTSLVVQWLRLHLPKQEVWVQSLVRVLRPHTPRGQKIKSSIEL